MLGQHGGGLLPTDPLLLQHNPQIPVSISTTQGSNLAGIQMDNNTMQNHQQQNDLNQSHVNRNDVRIVFL